MKINANFLNLKESYLFATVGRKTAEYKKAHPEKNVIRLSIGDVTRPLAPVVVEAMKRAAEEMGRSETFRGYGPDQTCYGYDKLLDSILGSYARKGVTLAKSEVFVSDGAKSDCGNILDIFSQDNVVLVPDPVYPVYVDTNVMGGRVIVYADATQENGFLPMPEKGTKADIIYICSPNNPTGAAYTREQLKEWVDFANENGAVILYDAAYEYFICDDSLCRSIYEVEGAKDCAIEICSYSKTAGFTGMRCGYTVIPNELKAYAKDGTSVSVSQIWRRRQGSKFNGVSYPVQCAAAAVFTEEGLRQTRKSIDYYMENARIMSKTCDELGISYTGGKNSPYIWLKCPNGMGSWEFFDYLLNEIQVVGTPGEGFGPNGKGWFRLTAFGSHENTEEAMKRLKTLLKK